MTDVDGLFVADPNKNKKAKLVPYRSRVGKAEFALADRKAISKVGTGGMYSKLLAADSALRAGITTHLVRGDSPNNLMQIATGVAIGTQFGGDHELAK
jgi:glutamate 5-kinase